MDVSIALTAADEDGEAYTIAQGMQYDSDLHRPTASAGAHESCKFNLGLGAVIGEIASPRDETQDVVRAFVRRYGLQDSGIDDRMGEVRDAARKMQDAQHEHDPDGLLALADQLYPGQKNVNSMVGENSAGFYILNHHPHVGLIRQAVHRGDNTLTVQAYHDSIYASVNNVGNMRGMTREIRDLRLAALLMRSAATRTVICAGNENMTFLHVVPTPDGTQVHEDFY